MDCLNPAEPDPILDTDEFLEMRLFVARTCGYEAQMLIRHYEALINAMGISTDWPPLPDDS